VYWDPNNLTVYFTAGQTGLSDAGEAAGSGETEESTGDEETEAQPENRGGGQNFQESLELASTSG
ncbi:MAG: hypothetical protein IBX71_07395, partial [Candidatus Desulforudis sp.]|nr:hypothetical protein [Desulforudis sp.]